MLQTRLRSLWILACLFRFYEGACTRRGKFFISLPVIQSILLKVKYLRYSSKNPRNLLNMENNYRNAVSCAVNRNENRNKQEIALNFTRKYAVNDFYLPGNIYLFKFNNRNTRKKCEICSMLTIKTPERRR